MIIHYGNPHKAGESLCGKGTVSSIVNDESLVTCRACKYALGQAAR